jgi:hypothetical protein
MKLGGFLACVICSVMFIRTEVLWSAAYENLTLQHNLLNLFLGVVCGTILIKLWVVGITTEFKAFEININKEERGEE